MKTNLGKQEAFLIIITIIFFGTFYALDRWLYQLRLEGQSNFEVMPFVWLSAFANVLLAGTLLFLAWYTLQKKRINFLVALLFIVAGVVMAFYPVLAFYGISLLPSVSMLSFGPTSLFTTGGAFLLVLGLLMVVTNLRH